MLTTIAHQDVLYFARLDVGLRDLDDVGDVGDFPECAKYLLAEVDYDCDEQVSGEEGLILFEVALVEDSHGTLIDSCFTDGCECQH